VELGVRGPVHEGHAALAEALVQHVIADAAADARVGRGPVQRGIYGVIRGIISSHAGDDSTDAREGTLARIDDVG
jgi:hypothetical protein